MEILLKRAYEPAAPSDGTRVLVDRLWPRGVSRERAALDDWAKEVAPSAELRTEWHHDPDGHSPEHFAAFAARYREELSAGSALAALDRLVALARSVPRVTLVYGAKDPVRNHAVVLRDALRARAEQTGPDLSGAH